MQPFKSDNKKERKVGLKNRPTVNKALRINLKPIKLMCQFDIVKEKGRF